MNNWTQIVENNETKVYKRKKNTLERR